MRRQQLLDRVKFRNRVEGRLGDLVDASHVTDARSLTVLPAAPHPGTEVVEQLLSRAAQAQEELERAECEWLSSSRNLQSADGELSELEQQVRDQIEANSAQLAAKEQIQSQILQMEQMILAAKKKETLVAMDFEEWVVM
uniref:Uncharacterized protein n=1 Tax=Oxyrrhis marina TaxID=2969 RepID=A0A7S3UIW7_OXYMA|mmetsp:Transcript_585/g.934  ORF Transcript_585/g.934 Transcript_585/m.934 type:complete len:140 (-) Transcript_585:20-439(-)